jgi:ATP-dependent helicase/nuclease subunit B
LSIRIRVSVLRGNVPGKGSSGDFMRSRVITTAYGRAAVESLRHVVSEFKHDDPMAPVTVLVPNNVAGIIARRHLAAGLAGRGNGVAGLYVSTLARLAEQIASPSLHPRRPATNAIAAAAWRAALDETPGCFERVKEHPATIRALTNAHRQLRDLSQAAREKARHATTLSPDLLRLHESVSSRLAEEWYDTTDLLMTAAALIEHHPAHALEYGGIVLYLPQELSQAEAAFARALGSVGLTVIAGLTGVKRADKTVRRSLSRLGFTTPEERPTAPLASRVLHASDADDEVRCMVREVMASLSRGAPAHRVAVLYGASQPYARLLHEHLEAADLKVNGPAARAVHERAIARGFLGVLKLAGSGLPRGAAFTALAEASTGDLDGGTVKVATWERVSRAAGVVGGEDWLGRLELYISHQRAVIDEQTQAEEPAQFRIEAAEREIDSARGLAGFISRLRTRLEEGLGLTSWADLSTWALALFQDLYGKPTDLAKLPAEEQYAAAVIEGTVRGLAGLTSFEPTTHLDRLVDVLGVELESALPRVGRFGEGIFVGPVSAAVGLDLEAVFVVGLAEDAFPGRLHEEALLNERLRQATGGELEEGRDRLDAKHRHVLAAFASAPEVTASFPRGDLRRSTERLPSRFLLHTLRAITGNDELAATDWDKASKYRRDTTGLLISSESFADTLRYTDQPSTEQEWRVRAASAGEDLDDSAVDAAQVLIAARAGEEFTRFDGILGNVAGLPDYASSELIVSPTALETFATCPRRFFLERLLHVEPLQDPEEVLQIQAADVGTLIHETMDALIKEAEREGSLPSYGEPWSAAQHQRLRQIALEKAEEFTSRGVTGHPRLWEADRAQILVDLDRMLLDDSRWRADRDAAVRGSELAFGMKGAPPLVVHIDRGEVRMRGSADKVDQVSDGTLLVTDIKSGRADKFKVLKDDPVAAGTKLQLPVYAHAARREFGGDTVEAQYWFVRRKDAGRRIPVVLDGDVEKQYAETLSTLVSAIAGGMFVGKPSEKPAWGYVDCPYCTPDGIGHDEARARYLRKRTSPALEPLMALIDPEAIAGGGQ